MARPSPRTARAVVAVAGLLLVLTGTAHADAGLRADLRAGVGPAPAPTAARVALDSARAALAGSGESATLALRDLVLSRPQLGVDERREADRILARPTDGAGDELHDGYRTREATPACSAVVCVHYVTSTADAVAPRDADDSGVPDFVDLALRTLTDVHRTYVAAGYRAPEPDGVRGGDPRTDVYLADLGAQGLYGYCTSDQPGAGSARARDVWSYCVLDNDYAETGFDAHTPRENLEVTAAHEYFHAVQFAYDYTEDGWLMEATATWAEDQLYDDVDDNAQYLADSPITRPGASIDQFRGLFHYGTWIFLRYLTERRPEAAGGLPTLVRDVWRAADAAPGGPDAYSLQAVRRVLEQRGWSLPAAFAGFSAANLHPEGAYAEARAVGYPAAPLAGVATLTRARPSTGTVATRLDHLTSSTYAIRPGTGLGGGTRLELRLDLAPTAQGSAAVVTVVPRSGVPVATRITLDPGGGARVVRGFDPRSVRAVEVTLVNADDAFRCDRGTRFSCAGLARHDDARELLVARITR